MDLCVVSTMRAVGMWKGSRRLRLAWIHLLNQFFVFVVKSSCARNGIISGLLYFGIAMPLYFMIFFNECRSAVL